MSQVRQVLEESQGEIDLCQADNEDKTALHLAAIEGHADVVQTLVDVTLGYGLSIDLVDGHGMSAYLYSRRHGHVGVTQVLADAGASTRLADDVTFRGGDEWEMEGKRERMRKHIKEHKDKLMFSRTYDHVITGNQSGK